MSHQSERLTREHSAIVESINHESRTVYEDHYSIKLKPGFADFWFESGKPLHVIDAWNLREAEFRLKQVKPCGCKECAASK